MQQKCPKYWKNSLYELLTELPLLLKSLFRHSDIPLLPTFVVSLPISKNLTSISKFCLHGFLDEIYSDIKET